MLFELKTIDTTPSFSLHEKATMPIPLWKRTVALIVFKGCMVFSLPKENNHGKGLFGVISKIENALCPCRTIGSEFDSACGNNCFPVFVHEPWILIWIVSNSFWREKGRHRIVPIPFTPYSCMNILYLFTQDSFSTFDRYLEDRTIGQNDMISMGNHPACTPVLHRPTVLMKIAIDAYLLNH